MENIIKIETSKGGKQIVNARDLWIGLESKSHFADWIKKKLLCNFEYNIDYSIIEYDIKGDEIVCQFGMNPKDQQVRVQKRDYPITLDTAKHIALMENTAKGKEVRAYFIECEKKLNTPVQSLPKNYKEALYALIEAEEVKEKLAVQIEENAPKVYFAETVQGSDDLILIRDLAKLTSINMGEKKLFKWLRDNKFLTLKNTPTQRSITLKVMELTERVHKGTISLTSKITPKGQIYFANKI